MNYIEDDKIEEESLLITQSPKLTLCSIDEEKDFLKSPLQYKTSQEQAPSWDDFIIDSILGEGAYGKVFKIYKKQELLSCRNINDQQCLGQQIDLFNGYSLDARPNSSFKMNSNKNIQHQSLSSFSSLACKLIPNNTEKKPVPYVIKELYTDMMPKEAALQAMEEISILGSLSSPFIVSYIDSFVSDTKVNIIMEFCENGDLQSFVNKKQKSGQQLNETTIWKCFIQICLGVHYLHSKEILHRDLKSLNIFLCKDNQLKIGDLGVARKLVDVTQIEGSQLDKSDQQQQAIDQTTKVGTPFYLAPEIWEGKPYTEKSDIWSLGVILYELCTLKKPYIADNMEALKEKVLKDNLSNPEVPVSRELLEIIKKLLRKNPLQRPSIKEIVQYSSFKNKAKQFKIELPSLINKVNNLTKAITKNVPTLQTKANNYMTAGKILQDSNKTQANGFQRKIAIQQAQKLNSVGSNLSIGTNSTINFGSSSTKNRIKDNLTKILEKSPKMIKKKLGSGLQGPKKMQLTSQRSVDNLGQFIGKLKQIQINLQFRKSQQVSQNISQTSFNSINSANTNKQPILRLNTLREKNQPQQQQQQIKKSTLKIHHDRTVTSTTNTTVNSSIQLDKMKKIFNDSQKLSKYSVPGKLHSQRAQKIVKNSSILDSVKASIYNKDAYQTNTTKKSDDQQNSSSVTLQDNQNKLHKWASKVTSRLLHKTKSTTLFRNHAQSIKNNITDSSKDLLSQNMTKNMNSDSIQDKKNNKVNKKVEAKSKKFLQPQTSQSIDFQIKPNSTKASQLHQIKNGSMKIVPNTTKGSKISLRKSNPNEYKKSSQHVISSARETFKQKPINCQSYYELPKCLKKQPFWDISNDQDKKLFNLKYEDSKSPQSRGDDDLLQDINDNSNIMLQLEEEDYRINGGRDENNINEFRRVISRELIFQSQDDNPFLNELLQQRREDTLLEDDDVIFGGALCEYEDVIMQQSENDQFDLTALKQEAMEVDTRARASVLFTSNKK